MEINQFQKKHALKLRVERIVFVATRLWIANDPFAIVEPIDDLYLVRSQLEVKHFEILANARRTDRLRDRNGADLDLQMCFENDMKW